MAYSKVNTPIFVTGIERSGGSLIARIIEMCGAFSGTTTNMCENVKIKKYVEYHYKANNFDYRGQYPLPNYKELNIPYGWYDDMEEIMKRQGYNGKKPWLCKSSKIGQTWPIWHHHFPDAKYIIVRRRTGDVIESCMKTGFMDAYSDPKVLKSIGVETEREGWLWWVHEQEKMLASMIEAGLNCKVIWPERMLDGNFQQIHEMLHWLGLPWKTGIISLLESTLIKTK